MPFKNTNTQTLVKNNFFFPSVWDGFNVGNLADLVEVRVHEGARIQSFSPRLPRVRQLAGLKFNLLLPSVHETEDKPRIGLYNRLDSFLSLIITILR